MCEMKKYFIAILAFLVIGLSTTGAQSYYGVSVGVTCLKIDEMRKMTFQMEDDGFCVNISQGYDFPDVPLRFEQQFCYSKHYFDSDCFIWGDSYKKDVPIYSFTIIENIFLDIGLEKFTPYIGLGVGYSRSRARGCWILDDDWDDYRFEIKKVIFQGTVGIRVPINGIFDLAMEYQFRLHKNNTFRENGLSIGVKTSI